jgi:hypothetical protein
MALSAMPATSQASELISASNMPMFAMAAPDIIK